MLLIFNDDFLGDSKNILEVEMKKADKKLSKIVKDLNEVSVVGGTKTELSIKSMNYWINYRNLCMRLLAATSNIGSHFVDELGKSHIFTREMCEDDILSNLVVEISYGNTIYCKHITDFIEKHMRKETCLTRNLNM